MRDEIKAHEAAGRLFFVCPALPGDKVVREMFVGRQIEPFLHPENLVEEEDGFRKGQVRPQLDIYTSGGRLNIALDPYDKDKSAHFARTDPVIDAIWDIRCTAPEARIRVFGRFADFNLFVALTWDYRENLITPEDWEREQDRFKQEWRSLFPYKPLYVPARDDGYVKQPFKFV